MERAHRKVRIRKVRVIEGILVALIVISLLNLFIIYTLTTPTGSGAKAPAAPKPAELKIVKISSSACTDCFDVDQLVSQIKQSGVSVGSEKSLESSSSEAKALISKYAISKLPALVITGGAGKAGLSQFAQKVDDAYVFSDAPMPYVNASTGEVVGRVSLAIIKDSSCSGCFDMSSLPAQLAQAGVKVSGTRVLELSSPEGRELVSKYDIKKVPAAILSKGLSAYPEIAQGWAGLGTVESDGSYVLRETIPPYVSVDTGEVVGKVSLTIVNASSCSDCFSPSGLPASFFLQAGVKVSDTRTLDSNSSEGKALIAKYNLTRLPGIVVSKDLSAYPLIMRDWGIFGSEESDGSYVWRNVAPYVSVGTGEVKGKAVLVSLVDGACPSCYDVSLQHQILGNFGLVFSKNVTYDVNSTGGRALIAKYNITGAPTVVLSQEASLYPLLVRVWPQVGTTESDGSFVFRNMAALRGVSYRDLKTGEIKTSAQAQ